MKVITVDCLTASVEGDAQQVQKMTKTSRSRCEGRQPEEKVSLQTIIYLRININTFDNKHTTKAKSVCLNASKLSPNLKMKDTCAILPRQSMVPFLLRI